MHPIQVSVHSFIRSFSFHLPTSLLISCPLQADGSFSQHAMANKQGRSWSVSQHSFFCYPTIGFSQRFTHSDAKLTLHSSYVRNLHPALEDRKYTYTFAYTVETHSCTWNTYSQTVSLVRSQQLTHTHQTQAHPPSAYTNLVQIEKVTC